MDGHNGPPPRYFGDHPHGAYWSADAPPGASSSDAHDDHVPIGPIQLGWDYAGPLWDAEGLLDSEPEALRKALGLDDALIRDLLQWNDDMHALDAAPVLRLDEAYAAMDARARQLLVQLEEQVGSRYEVSYRPW